MSFCHADVSHLLHQEHLEYETTTAPSPPNPYFFEYAAGRAPGHIDRTQQESGDGVGHVQGKIVIKNL